MSDLHAVMRDDLAAFLNLDEFAATHVFRGQSLACVVDDGDSLASASAADGFRNATALGVLRCDRVVCCRADDVSPEPAPGERVEMDGRLWLVGDGVTVAGGLLTVPLHRAY